MTPQPVAILGSSGNSVDILDSMLEVNRHLGHEKYRPIGFLDDRAEPGTQVHGFPVLGPLKNAKTLDSQVHFSSAIGSSASYRSKPTLLESLGLPWERFATIIHPSAHVSQWAELGRGCLILQQCTLSAGCKLGDHVVMLPGCRISHDTVVEDYNVLATGVILCGHVRVAPNCYLGAGSLVRERLQLGEGCLVGMGSVVVKSVAAGQRVAGNPARLLV